MGCELAVPGVLCIFFYWPRGNTLSVPGFVRLPVYPWWLPVAPLIPLNYTCDSVLALTSGIRFRSIYVHVFVFTLRATWLCPSPTSPLLLRAAVAPPRHAVHITSPPRLSAPQSAGGLARCRVLHELWVGRWVGIGRKFSKPLCRCHCLVAWVGGWVAGGGGAPACCIHTHTCVGVCPTGGKHDCFLTSALTSLCPTHCSPVKASTP